jgi:hypothetical protein
MDLEMGDDYNRPTYESETETAKRMLDAYAEIQAKLTKSEAIRFEQGNRIISLERERDALQKEYDEAYDAWTRMLKLCVSARRFARYYYHCWQAEKDHSLGWSHTAYDRGREARQWKAAALAKSGVKGAARIAHIEASTEPAWRIRVQLREDAQKKAVDTTVPKKVIKRPVPKRPKPNVGLTIMDDEPAES